MANIKSAKKRAKTSEVKRKRNAARKSEIHTLSKKLIESLGKNDVTGAETQLKLVEAKIARARSKGVVKRNAASRKISKLAKKVAVAKKGTSKK